MTSKTMIERICLRQLAVSPAIGLSGRLSEVKQFDVILVEMENKCAEKRQADALLLARITPETLQQAWMLCCILADIAIGMQPEDAITWFLQSHSATPFMVTALVTAVEMSAGL